MYMLAGGYFRRFLGLSCLVFVGAAVLVLCHDHVEASSAQSEVKNIEAHDTGSKMVAYIKQERYDEAIQVGMDWLQDHPGDDFVHQEIANVYLIRAQKENPSQREQWVAKAIFYSDKAANLHSKNKDVAGVQLFQVARGFEAAGDLSTTEKCSCYARARKLLQEREPSLQGDQITLDGRTYKLAPLRKENEKILAEVTEKATKAGCK